MEKKSKRDKRINNGQSIMKMFQESKNMGSTFLKTW